MSRWAQRKIVVGYLMFCGNSGRKQGSDCTSAGMNCETFDCFRRFMSGYQVIAFFGPMTIVRPNFPVNNI